MYVGRCYTSKRNLLEKNGNAHTERREITTSEPQYAHKMRMGEIRESRHCKSFGIRAPKSRFVVSITIRRSLLGYVKGESAAETVPQSNKHIIFFMFG